MSLPAPITDFDVSEFDGFLETLGLHYSVHVQSAFLAATKTIKRAPISTATFKVKVGSLQCIGLPLVSAGGSKLYQTGFYVAYIIRNERIIPVDVDRMAGLK